MDADCSVSIDDPARRIGRVSAGKESDLVLAVLRVPRQELGLQFVHLDLQL
jgi:hypothetical protein